MCSINSTPTLHASLRIACAVPRSRLSPPAPNSAQIVPSRSTPTLIVASEHAASSSVASTTPCLPIFVVVTTTPHLDTSTREHASGSSSISNSPPAPSSPTPATVTFGIFVSANAARTPTLSASNIDPRSHAHAQSTVSVHRARPGFTHNDFKSIPNCSRFPIPRAIAPSSSPASSPSRLRTASRPMSTDSNARAYVAPRFSAASSRARSFPPSRVFTVALASTRTTTRPQS
mmetsp:Transcript_3129/g.12035  ORF Transcript_3129/g.12035 Transcript_3129/m.12035 type:complete len:232 (-) Transcript_3129:244-939(-)